MASTISIGIFKFQKGKGYKAEEHLAGYIKILKEFQGCNGAWLSQADGDLDNYLIMSLWKDMNAHLEMENVLRTEEKKGVDFKKVAKYLREPPYFSIYYVME
ncbi:MAG: antibiotic biosynthesis monooxygenase [Candidatus Thermoplasmatota archaeon]|nr:antibiotic biosynthesis monooxygenase [Candidatus Thermoplasmatota archaeon]